jgi:hypothetical protein
MILQKMNNASADSHADKRREHARTHHAKPSVFHFCVTEAIPITKMNDVSSFDLRGTHSMPNHPARLIKNAV